MADENAAPGVSLPGRLASVRMDGELPASSLGHHALTSAPLGAPG
jgi:hypothetical protein